MQDSRPPIYSLTLDIQIKKGKQVYNRTTWAVCRYDTPADIMAHSKYTMDRLRNEFYGKNHKGEKRILIKKVRDKKIVGYVNSNAI